MIFARVDGSLHTRLFAAVCESYWKLNVKCRPIDWMRFALYNNRRLTFCRNAQDNLLIERFICNLLVNKWSAFIIDFKDGYVPNVDSFQRWHTEMHCCIGNTERKICAQPFLTLACSLFVLSFPFFLQSIPLSIIKIITLINAYFFLE